MSHATPSPTSRRTEGKQHIHQRAMAGEITQGEAARQLARFDVKNRGGRSRLRRLAVLAHRSYERGNIDVIEWRQRLAAVRQECAARGYEALPEAEAKESQSPDLSQSKREALAALHASRRGVPVHPLPAKIESALTLIRELINKHNSGAGGPIPSARKFALKINVQPRTVGRWLDGVIRPDPRHHDAILKWRDECKASIHKDAR